MFEQHLRGTVCELPGGLFLDGGRLMSVELRPLSGHEENWLAEHSASGAAAVTAVIGDCLVHTNGAASGRDLARQLLAGDRDFLILQLRRLTLGERLQAVLDCPVCTSRIDVEFLACDVSVERNQQTAASYTFNTGSRQLRFRLPNGADQEAVSGLPVTDAADRLLMRCLLDESSEPLSETEKAAVIQEMERHAPRVELELDISCPECGHQFAVPFDTTAFFLQEVRVKRERLLREVHTLALFYHWSETEILCLPRPRRRAYLELISDSVRER